VIGKLPKVGGQRQRRFWLGVVRLTLQVIEKFSEAVNEGETLHTDVFLVCGSDLLDSFNTPGLWSEEDMRFICGEGICCVQRQGRFALDFSHSSGVSVADLAATNALLGEYYNAGKILAFTPSVENNVSSTLVRYGMVQLVTNRTEQQSGREKIFTF
jgi:nicotinic acid mononucleotide adenylyltransferase